MKNKFEEAHLFKALKEFYGRDDLENIPVLDFYQKLKEFKPTSESKDVHILIDAMRFLKKYFNQIQEGLVESIKKPDGSKPNPDGEIGLEITKQESKRAVRTYTRAYWKENGKKVTASLPGLNTRELK